MANGFNLNTGFTKTLVKKEITAIIEDAVKDFEKEEADKIHAKIGFTIPNSKPQKDTLSRNESKALKELKHKTSIVNLPADKGKSTVSLNRENYLEKCIDDIPNSPSQKIIEKTLPTKSKLRH